MQLCVDGVASASFYDFLYLNLELFPQCGIFLFFISLLNII